MSTTATADGRSPEHAWPVREIAVKLRDYIARLSRVWIEGQVVEVSRRGGNQVYVTLRDARAEASVQLVMSSAVDRSLVPALAAGQRVVAHVECEYWVNFGRLVLRAHEVRPVGVGELLAAIERRKQQLAAEGLFAVQRKRPLPVLPRRVGLISGVNAQAMHDVVVNARRRWPAVEFVIRQCAVQGVRAVPSIIMGLDELEAIDDVDVIVIARGGGSLEDLLPFSDESLIRAVANVRTPVVSAIGHEQDSPLLDLVADLRASTPTDAGRRIVPDWAEETRGISDRRRRLDRHILTQLDQASARLDQTRSRPSLADPAGILPRLAKEVQGLRLRCFHAVDRRLIEMDRRLAAVRAHARALSPLATLERGYAVVVGPHGVVRAADQLVSGDAVAVRVATGGFRATVTEVRRSDVERMRQ